MRSFISNMTVAYEPISSHPEIDRTELVSRQLTNAVCLESFKWVRMTIHASALVTSHIYADGELSWRKSVCTGIVSLLC